MAEIMEPISGGSSVSEFMAANPGLTLEDYAKYTQARREAIAAAIGVTLPELHDMGPEAARKALNQVQMQEHVA